METGIQNVKDVNRIHDEHDEKELKLKVSALVATLLEKMYPFMLQICCNASLLIASTNVICKCESTDYSVLASLAWSRHFDFSMLLLLSAVVN